MGAHPGYSRTGLLSSGPRLGGGGGLGAGSRAGHAVHRPDAARGALPVLRAATDPRAQGGDYYGPGGPGQLAGSPRKVRYASKARDEQLGRRLWQASEALTGTTFPGPAGRAATPAS